MHIYIHVCIIIEIDRSIDRYIERYIVESTRSILDIRPTTAIKQDSAGADVAQSWKRHVRRLLVPHSPGPTACDPRTHTSASAGERERERERERGTTLQSHDCREREIERERERESTRALATCSGNNCQMQLAPPALYSRVPRLADSLMRRALTVAADLGVADARLPSCQRA